MRLVDHLAFLGRRLTKVGDEIIFHDNLPPPTEQELAESYDAAYAAWAAAQSPPKRWANVEHFVAEFSPDELADIALSSDRAIASLRLTLQTWLSEVHSTDPRVQQGLDRLVELSILTPERKNQILGT